MKNLIIILALTFTLEACSSYGCDDFNTDDVSVEVTTNFASADTDEELKLPIQEIHFGGVLLYKNTKCTDDSCPPKHWVNILDLDDLIKDKVVSIKQSHGVCDSTMNDRIYETYHGIVVEMFKPGVKGVVYNGKVYSGYPNGGYLAFDGQTIQQNSNAIDFTLSAGGVERTEDMLATIDCEEVAAEDNNYASDFDKSYCSDEKPLCTEDGNSCLDLQSLRVSAMFSGPE